ncbi:MAG: DUF2811 domain-containing protein [Synechococcaceae cyanobacterium]|nr:DUF2811 domain-containing protein [Synechococcaceae cyanobacterium]
MDQQNSSPRCSHLRDEATVSLRADVPEPLLQAMRQFIDGHPNWDQYRLFKAALAGFLVQNGISDRSVTRCYLANLFPGQGNFSSSPWQNRPSPEQDGLSRIPIAKPRA